jgi:ParB family chromosome partitioning protein
MAKSTAYRPREPVAFPGAAAPRPEDTAEVAAPMTRDPAMKLVHPDLIDPDPGQPRKHFDEAELDGLAESMADGGQQQNIVVYEVKGAGRFRLVAGERRWRAAKKKGLTLSCRVLAAAPDETAAILAQLDENDQRSDLNFVERGDAYRRLMTKEGWDAAELARRVHRPEALVRKALSVEEFSSPELKAAVAAEAVTQRAAYQSSRIADPEARAEVERGLIDGTKTEEDAQRAAAESQRSTRSGRPRKKVYSESVKIDGGYTVTVSRSGSEDSPGYPALAAAAQAAAEIFRLRQGAAA